MQSANLNFEERIVSRCVSTEYLTNTFACRIVDKESNESHHACQIGTRELGTAGCVTVQWEEDNGRSYEAELPYAMFQEALVEAIRAALTKTGISFSGINPMRYEHKWQRSS
jgi:hypothetical protein